LTKSNLTIIQSRRLSRINESSYKDSSCSTPSSWTKRLDF
jgi:hypothetical protein